jgi:hypothetical protein
MSDNENGAKSAADGVDFDRGAAPDSFTSPSPSPTTSTSTSTSRVGSALEGRGQRGLEEHVRVVREGHGANCSSIGSVIDTLFVAQITAGALLAAVAAALAVAGTEKDDRSEDAAAEEDA